MSPIETGFEPSGSGVDRGVESDPLRPAPGTPRSGDEAARERRLLFLSAALTFVLAVSAIGVGLLSASQAIVFDGMYALVDTGMALAAWAVARLVVRGEDRRFQFGYWHLEPMLAFLSGALGLFATLYAVVDAAGSLLTGGRAVAYDIGVVFTLGVASISFVAFVVIRRKGQGLESTLLTMEARAWLHGGIMSAALGASFATAAWLETSGRGDLAVYADPVTLLLLAIVLAPYPVRALWRNGREILQIAPPELDVRVGALAREMTERHGFADHRFHVTRVGRAQFVEIGFVARSGENVASYAELDRIRREVADALGRLAPSCWLTVEFTADPRWL